MHFHLGARIIYSVTFYISFWLSACNHYGVNGWSRAGHQEGSSGLSLIIFFLFISMQCDATKKEEESEFLKSVVELCCRWARAWWCITCEHQRQKAEAAAPGYCWSTAKAPAPWYHPPPAEEPVSKNELPSPVYYRACYPAPAKVPAPVYYPAPAQFAKAWLIGLPPAYSAPL